MDYLISGRHTVEILHNGDTIMGSPFYVEIYDPNKIRVEGSRSGEVGERMEFDGKTLEYNYIIDGIVCSLLIMLFFFILNLLNKKSISNAFIYCCSLAQTSL